MKIFGKIKAKLEAKGKKPTIATYIHVFVYMDLVILLTILGIWLPSLVTTMTLGDVVTRTMNTFSWSYRKAQFGVQ